MQKAQFSTVKAAPWSSCSVDSGDPCSKKKELSAPPPPVENLLFWLECAFNLEVSER